MKIFKSYWVLGLLALVISFLTSTLFIFQAKQYLLTEIYEVYKKPEQEKPGFWSFRSREIAKLVNDLLRQNKINREEQAKLKESEAQIQSEKRELAETRNEIENLRNSISQEILEIKKSEEANLSELAITYSNLPPDTTIEIFKEMDDLFVVKILSFMEPDSVAGIFQAMVKQGDKSKSAAKRVANLTELLRLRKEKIKG